jgi:hypothetical protein
VEERMALLQGWKVYQASRKQNHVVRITAAVFTDTLPCMQNQRKMQFRFNTLVQLKPISRAKQCKLLVAHLRGEVRKLGLIYVILTLCNSLLEH